MKAKVTLFKPSGKYYTEEEWEIPENAIGPYDMAESPDFRAIGGGPVLVETQEPWGFPDLLISGTQKVPGKVVPGPPKPTKNPTAHLKWAIYWKNPVLKRWLLMSLMINEATAKSTIRSLASEFSGTWMARQFR